MHIRWVVGIRSIMLGSEPIAHCLLFSDLANREEGQLIEIEGEEAHHAARVKRVRPGERLLLLDGAGHWSTGTLESLAGSKSKPLLRIVLGAIEAEASVSPSLEVWAAMPKGDRLDRMVDQLTQLGAAGFRPLLCERSQRKSSTVRPEKLQRIADEAMKQSHRPWRLEVGEPIPFVEAIRDPDAVVADGSGSAWGERDHGKPRTVVLIGPEGGWSNTERASFVELGVPVRSFGRFVLRIEAAAPAAAAIVMGATPGGSTRNQSER